MDIGEGHTKQTGKWKQETQLAHTRTEETTHTDPDYSLTKTHAGGHLSEELWGRLQDAQSGSNTRRHTNHAQRVA